MKHHFPALLLLMILASCQWHQNRFYQVAALSASVVTLDSLVKSDSLTDAFVLPFRDSVQSKMNREIGWSEVALTVYTPESPMSNFVADLMLTDSRTQAANQQLAIPDFALVNIKGLRTGLPQGRITVSNIFQLMPFENEVVMVQLTGDEVLQLFSHMASMGGDGVGGASFVIRNNVVENPCIGGIAVDTQRSYWVVTSDYLAGGGDRYKMLAHSTAVKLEITLRDMILHHIEALTAANKFIQATTDQRIRHEQ